MGAYEDELQCLDDDIDNGFIDNEEYNIRWIEIEMEHEKERDHEQRKEN